jgi:protein-S-isoprenylcysteine O-methyltransferase Ste14
MTEKMFFNLILYSWFVLAGITFISLFFITAPYGRYTRSGFGPQVSRKTGWILMELPSATLVALFFITSDQPISIAQLSFLFLWHLHYWHRTFIFPFRMRGANKRITFTPIILGMIFNSGNAYLNGRYLFSFGPGYPDTWLQDPRFIIGICLFFIGFVINKHSDTILRNLRQPNDTGYKIPQGGMYRFISCPNYFGEIIEWLGWALATWSLAGLSFAVFTMANLVPRAWSHHCWYKNEFSNYPTNRKAILPYIF